MHTSATPHLRFRVVALRRLALFVALFGATFAAHAGSAATATPAHAHPVPPAADATTKPRGALVIFITQIDPMIAGHALHFAEHMHTEGRGVTLFLIGEGARLALRDPRLEPSIVTEAPLNEKLAELLAGGARVIVTPFSLKGLGVTPEALVPGIDLRCDPSLHDHMFEPDTRLMVW